MEVSSDDKDTQKSLEQIQGQKDLLKALLFCVIAVIIVRSFIVEPFRIPSSSMVPTLKIGDYIFVSKFAYGLSIPFTKYEFVSWGTPKRGDVVVFLWPRDESLHYVKRVVGLPGDKIEIKGKEIFINDQPIRKDPVVDLGEIQRVMDGPPGETELFREKIGAVEHFVRHTEKDTMGVGRRNFLEAVPPNSYFVMGDNRDDSSDSRSWGFVPQENIKGRALIIWLSVDQESSWGSVKKIRWHRTAEFVQ